MASGLDRFVDLIESYASQISPGPGMSARFVARLGEDCAFICARDVWRPIRFLRQMAGPPPISFGISGFDPALVDDYNPVRHYMAFVVVGFWLPALPAIVMLYVWETLGFLRYGGRWSAHDVRSGWIGLRHGRRVRQMGPWVLPVLARRDLSAHAATSS
jgi:hypothetical protein